MPQKGNLPAIYQRHRIDSIPDDTKTWYSQDMTPDRYLSASPATNPVPLAETPRAKLWRVNHHNGPAVLKVFTERGTNAGDMNGTALLRLWDGDGAARLLAQIDNAILIEWLPGQSLKDTLSGGDDDVAAEVISEVSSKLRRSPIDGFLNLEDHFGGTLLSAKKDDFPEPFQAAFGRAQALFHRLQKTTQQPCLMHGDLNYQNIISSDRGWLAIDPKGIIADPCYEFGVAFRNPTDDPDRVAAPERILKLAASFASHTKLNEKRILQFGFLHVAMSLAYHYKRTSDFSETDLAIFRSFDGLLRAGAL